MNLRHRQLPLPMFLNNYGGGSPRVPICSVNSNFSDFTRENETQLIPNSVPGSSVIIPDSYTSSINTFNSSMPGPCASSPHTISSPSTRLNSQSYSAWGLHSNISTNSTNQSEQIYLSHKPDEVMELRQKIQELEREKELNTRQTMTTEAHPSAHSMQSQYINHGNSEQPPYRWNQQNCTHYPDTRFSEAAYPMRNRTESFASHDSYKSRLPYLNGKADWKTFMVQFQIIAERNKWSPRQQTEEILLVLKDEALTFATELAPELRTSFILINFPETYRREL
ncbi:unnamed protein product [Mytilus coruscus]|uniref:Uncharacterized protein n=1 Tax=Mytilus coruscus TaxID=42192 RepID=A0A6J8B145_MYTCO|nr:unnamed protein product [Mytilus coruscus]